MKSISFCATWVALLLTLAVASASTLYVSLSGDNIPPFASLETAARTLQQAADIATRGDEILVAPGIYTNGGATAGSSLSNRVSVPDGVSMRSTDGPEITIIEGIRPSSSNAVRCVRLGFDSTIQGFTLQGGGTRSYLQDVYRAQSGGGASCEKGAKVIDCIVINNDAYNYGGGVYGGTVIRSTIAGNSALRGGGTAFTELDECAVSHNTASHIGAGVYRSVLRRSTVVSNRSSYAGGGVYETDSESSVIVDNHAVWVAPNYKWGVFSNVCTHPLPEGGTNNFTDVSLCGARKVGAPSEVVSRIPNAIARKKAQSSSRLDRQKAKFGLIDLPPKNTRKNRNATQTQVRSDIDTTR